MILRLEFSVILFKFTSLMLHLRGNIFGWVCFVLIKFPLPSVFIYSVIYFFGVHLRSCSRCAFDDFPSSKFLDCKTVSVSGIPYLLHAFCRCVSDSCACLRNAVSTWNFEQCDYELLRSSAVAKCICWSMPFLTRYFIDTNGDNYIHFRTINHNINMV